MTDDSEHFIFSATFGDGLVVVPISFAMHHYGTAGQPNFMPMFVVYFFGMIASGISMFFLKAKVRSLLSFNIQVGVAIAGTVKNLVNWVVQEVVQKRYELPAI